MHDVIRLNAADEAVAACDSYTQLCADALL